MREKWRRKELTLTSHVRGDIPRLTESEVQVINIVAHYPLGRYDVLAPRRIQVAPTLDRMSTSNRDIALWKLPNAAGEHAKG